MSQEFLRPSQRLSRRRFAGVVAGVAGAVAAARGTAFAGPGFRVRAKAANAQDGAIFRMQYANLTTLDPHFVGDGMWFVGEGLLEGLTQMSADGKEAVPAAAESWDISEDGTTYTFHIRESGWSNGDPVTANDFEWTYQRLLNPSFASAGNTVGANSFQPLMGITGSREYFGGTITDWEDVGITAVDEKTLEITLDAPNAEFPLLLTHPSMLPLHQATLESTDEWVLPENWVGNGAFTLESWTINTEMTLVPNEHYWDRENVQLAGIHINFAGEGAIGFEAGELDMVGLQPADIIRFQADPELADMLKSAPAGSVGYLAKLRSKNPILDDINIRKALSLGMDRDVVGTVQPQTRVARQLIPDSVAGVDPEHDTPFDLEQARQLLADAGYPNGEGFPEIKILHGVESIAVEALADTWREHLGINVKVDLVEPGVYVERRWAVQEEDYIGFYFGTFGSPPAWSAWVGNLWSPQFMQELSLPQEIWAEYQAVQNDIELDPAERNEQLAALRAEHASEETKAFEEAALKVSTLSDSEEQMAAFREAARIRQESYLVLPFFYNDAYWAQQPNVEGINYLQGGVHFYYKTITKS
ncbi:MAG TPA: peptide ABC transporter substrate-binding protein [Thermomicrobiales bacterium]|nr:peptide ABC transporter substrate-binding protein [Thermomicrobiales bacterium]